MKINLNAFQRYRFLQLSGSLPDRWKGLMTWEQRKRHNLMRYHIEYTLDYYLYRGEESQSYRNVYTLIQYGNLEPSVFQEVTHLPPSFLEWRDVQVIARVPV